MSKHNRERRKAGRRYAAAVANAVQPGQIMPGQLYTITVRHDPACALLRGTGVCDCKPEVHQPKRVVRPEDN